VANYLSSLKEISTTYPLARVHPLRTVRETDRRRMTTMTTAWQLLEYGRPKIRPPAKFKPLIRLR